MVIGQRLPERVGTEAVTNNLAEAVAMRDAQNAIPHRVKSINVNDSQVWVDLSSEIEREGETKRESDAGVGAGVDTGVVTQTGTGTGAGEGD